MNYSIRITFSMLLVSSPIWTMQSDPTLLTLSDLDQTIAQYQSDSLTKRVADHFINCTYRPHARFYNTPRGLTATAIVNAALIALKLQKYPIDKTQIANNIFQSASRPMRLVAYALDDICRAWHQKDNKNMQKDALIATPDDLDKLYALAINRAKSAVRMHDASYLANGLQKYISMITRDK